MGLEQEYFFSTTVFFASCYNRLYLLSEILAEGRAGPVTVPSVLCGRGGPRTVCLLKVHQAASGKA